MISLRFPFRIRLGFGARFKSKESIRFSRKLPVGVLLLLFPFNDTPHRLRDFAECPFFSASFAFNECPATTFSIDLDLEFVIDLDCDLDSEDGAARGRTVHIFFVRFGFENAVRFAADLDVD